MYLRRFRIQQFDHNTFLLCRVCLVWIAGLSLGYAAARFYGDTLMACVHLSTADPATFSGALSVNLFPLLISACAVFFYRSLVLPLCLLRGLIFGLGAGTVCLIFGSAGLMLTLLLMFSAVAFAPVMLWFFCRRTVAGNESLARDTLVCGVLALVIAMSDVWIVSPILREIMIF